MEALPHTTFWLELKALAVDGLVFTAERTKQVVAKAGGGEGGGAAATAVVGNGLKETARDDPPAAQPDQGKEAAGASSDSDSDLVE